MFLVCLRMTDFSFGIIWLLLNNLESCLSENGDWWFLPSLLKLFVIKSVWVGNVSYGFLLNHEVMLFEQNLLPCLIELGLLKLYDSGLIGNVVPKDWLCPFVEFEM